ncbi:MAG: ABC transporter ATP-binding protein/permease [Defluviitaleaceae bacterium]|nr:ABC transporter ATP-binding protein/permease [Defluviitaleaceae bacterium]
MALAFFQAIISTTVTALTTALFIDTAISIFEGEALVGAIYLPLGILIFIIFVNSVLSNLPTLISLKIEFAIERHFAPEILTVRANLAYKHIEDADSWDLVERVSENFKDNLQAGIRAYEIIIRSVVAITSVLGLILVHVWWAVPIIVAFSIPLFWIALYAGQKNYNAEVQTRKYERRYSYYSDEVLTNRESVEERTLFGYTDDVVKRYSEQFEIARKIQLRAYLKTYIAMKSVSISMALIALLIAFTLINPVITGNLSPGMFMGIITSVFAMISTLGWSLQDAAKNLSKSREFMNDLTEFTNLSRTKGATDLPDKQPLVFESLEFRNVYFKYPTEENPILNGLSFSLESGKHYAFVGVNGAGKTTITKLLTGLYDEYEGEILINNKELRTYPASTLKALFSVVYQDFSRYQISMADNIAVGNSAKVIDEQQIYDIVTRVGLTDVVDKLSNGIKTPLGKTLEGGVDISGGQWQKVAIARSLLSQAPIKILDEPTAALDPIAESQIYQEFENLMQGKTTIFISHRLGSTKLADEILVIDEGKIFENGNHDELMRKKGIYAQMFEVQRKWYE